MITGLNTKKNTYAFGMPMPGRNYNSSNYSYGFGGKRKDDEIAGNGNYYDYDARMYDPRLVRTPSGDPHASSYPWLSPYSMFANNPILYIDNDGRDFGVYINHTDNTVIIKATLHTVKGETSSANSAAMSWNSQNIKYQYKVGNGPNAKYYDVKFEITVKEHDTYEKRDDAYFGDKSGEGNRYDMVKDGDIGDNYGITIESPVTLDGASDISVEASSERRKSGSHETGHALGIGHWISGLMKGKNRQDNETNITKGNVTKILNNAGLGKEGNDPTDMEIEAPTNKAKIQTHNEGGTEPTDFKTGELIEKP